MLTEKDRTGKKPTKNITTAFSGRENWVGEKEKEENEKGKKNVWKIVLRIIIHIVEKLVLKK